MFTLIVLAYNEEKYIEKTIKESFNHFDEVIIVNDSSKDETLNKINKLELQDFNNLKIINNHFNSFKNFCFEYFQNDKSIQVVISKCD